MSRSFNEDAALDYQPFYGDETDVSEFTDKFVKAAKNHAHCNICHGPIKKGERHRAKTERNNEERKIQTFRFCSKCCRAMANCYDYEKYTMSDPDRLINSRYRIGERARSESKP